MQSGIMARLRRLFALLCCEIPKLEGFLALLRNRADPEGHVSVTRDGRKSFEVPYGGTAI